MAYIQKLCMINRTKYKDKIKKVLKKKEQEDNYTAQKTRKTKTEIGITLVALIITIIILLILAVVAISAVTGDGIIQHAKNSRSEYGKAQTDERDMLSKYEYEIAKAQGTATGSYKDYLLQKEYGEKKNAGSFTGTYMEYVTSKYGLGTATNTSNYGKKVVGYKSKGEGLDTLVWRLFYQDDKNAYLISFPSALNKVSFYTLSEGKYTEKDILKKYNSGADVSIYGQALMQEASSLFTTSNINKNILVTAYLCDPEVWDAYTDAEGKASYAIGSPTIELFAKSYNASDLGHTITIGTDANGYTHNIGYQWIGIGKNFIYNQGVNGYCWLVGPADTDRLLFITKQQMTCYASDVYSSNFYSRPIVSIPLSEFEGSYTLVD